MSTPNIEGKNTSMSTDLSDGERKKLVADEARELAKQQQKELARIRREMRGMDNKKMVMLAIAAIIVLFALAGGGYVFWCNFRIRLNKTNFMAEYKNTDIKMCQTFTPREWTRVEQLKQAAESASILLASGEIIKKYEQATKDIISVKNKAVELREQHKIVSQDYEKALRENKDRDWQKYEPQVHARIQEAVARVNQNPYDLEEMRKVIAMTKETAEIYPLIVDYTNAKNEYLDAYKGINEADWAEQLAEELNAVKNQVRMAEDAFHGGFWRQSADAYRAATELIMKGAQDVGAVKQTAEAVMLKFVKAYDETDQVELQKNARVAWEQLSRIKNEMDSAWRQNQYAKTTETANDAYALLGKTVERIKEAKTTRDAVLAELNKAFEQVQPLRQVLQRNWPKAWESFYRSYLATMELSRTEDYVAFLDNADVTKNFLKNLLNDYNSVSQTADKIKEDFEKLRDSVDEKALNLNVPEIWSRAQVLWNSAERSVEQKQIQSAIDAYAESEKLIRAAMKAFEILKDNALQLQEEALRRQKQYLNGFKRFSPRPAAAVGRTFNQGRTAMKNGNFREARVFFINVNKILPEQQYVPVGDGTMIDYVNGLMWAQDGRGSGCNNGQLIDWYKAVVWVAGLRLGNYLDWQLPTDEQLVLLTEIPADELQKLFPNTRIDAPYWSREHSHKGIDTIIAVDFGSGRKELLNKTASGLVRAVRIPR